MSWFNQKIYSEEEIRIGTAMELPCNFQIGTDVWLHVFDENGTASVIDSVVAGVNVSSMHQITYDLYFKIGDRFYVRVNGFRGFVSKVGEYLDVEGGLVSADELVDVLKHAEIKPVREPIRNSHLSLVGSLRENNDGLV